MLSSDQGPRNASGGLNAAGLTSRPRFGAGATVDRGLPASKYAPVKLILALMSYGVDCYERETPEVVVHADNGAATTGCTHLRWPSCGPFLGRR